MEVLIKEGDYVNFLIEFEEGDSETSVTFNVYEVTSWNSDNKEVSDTKHYLKGYIKWNGCSHIWFGDEDGYLHLCGKTYFERHKQVMDAIWDVCSKKIKGWENETPHFGNVLLPAVNYWKMEETFIQVKRRHRKEKKKCQKIVAKQVRELKKQGYTSSGWVDGYYGTYFRHWGKDGVNKYLEYYKPWLWRLAVV